MKKTKAILAFAIALTMVFGNIALPANVSDNTGSGLAISAEAETYGDYEYSVLVDGTVEITKFTCTDTAVRINWEKVSNASGYRIYRYNTSTKKWNTVATLSGANTLTYKQTGLKAGTTYKYKVKAYTKSNGKTYWGESSSTMTTTTKPAKPTIKSYSSTASAVRINWNTVTGATGYRVYRYDTKTKKYELISTIRDGSANTYRDSGLKAKTAYQYKVKAYRKLGSVNYWSESSIAKTCTTKPQDTVQWSESMKTWRKLCECKDLSQREQDIIRSEILEYAEKFNGKKDIHVSFGIDEFDISYEKPLNMTVREDMTDPKLYAHMDAYVDPNRIWLIDYAESEEEIYELVSEAREDCLHVIDHGLFKRWEIYTINDSLDYASDIEFNIGFDDDMYIWFLTKD